MLAKLHPIKTHAERTSCRYFSYFDIKILLLYYVKYDEPEISFGCGRRKKFEINDLAYNAWKHCTYQVHVTKCKQCNRHVNLLLFTDEKKNKAHYVLIKNMSRLLSHCLKQRTNHYYCDYCLHGFIRTDLLDNHVEDCKQYGVQKVVMPNRKEDKWVYYKAIERQLPVPMVVYADFESFTKNSEHNQPSIFYRSV